MCKYDPELAAKRATEIQVIIRYIIIQYIEQLNADFPLLLQGHLVNLPLDFLNKEVLTPPGTSKEGLIPTSVWT